MMSTQNFFALLGDDENEDPMALAARVVSVIPAVPGLKEQRRQPQAQGPAKFPTKPVPPEQAIREARGDGARSRGRRGRGLAGGRGNYGNRDRGYEDGETNINVDRVDYGDRHQRNGGESRNGNVDHAEGGLMNGGFPAPTENGGSRTYDAGRGRGRGRGRTNGYVADGEERPGRRIYERRSGTGRGNEIKREGAGKGNWGLEVDQNAVQAVEENITNDGGKTTMTDFIEKNAEEAQAEFEEKKDAEEEDKEMTLEEYEKILEEKRKGLQALKAQERKVLLDRDFESMQLVDKKIEDDFLKLRSEKGKKKEILEKEERVRKSVNINEFLRPADGERYYVQSGRQGRTGGRGRPDRGSFSGGIGGRYRSSYVAAPEIGDPGHFPTLGGQ